jgi:hypothetical protein
VNTIQAIKRCIDLIENYPEERLPGLIVTLEDLIKKSDGLVDDDENYYKGFIKSTKSLEDMFKLYPADYIEEEELDWGSPVGDEVW